MICTYCNKTIDIQNQKYEMFGYDSFVHTHCRPSIENEFSKWIQEDTHEAE